MIVHEHATTKHMKANLGSAPRMQQNCVDLVKASTKTMQQVAKHFMITWLQKLCDCSILFMKKLCLSIQPQ